MCGNQKEQGAGAQESADAKDRHSYSVWQILSRHKPKRKEQGDDRNGTKVQIVLALI
jgi:hypothetical protein